jgi:hypothetical protein
VTEEVHRKGRCAAWRRGVEVVYISFLIMVVVGSYDSPRDARAAKASAVHGMQSAPERGNSRREGEREFGGSGTAVAKTRATQE